MIKKGDAEFVNCLNDLSMMRIKRAFVEGRPGQCEGWDWTEILGDRQGGGNGAQIIKIELLSYSNIGEYELWKVTYQGVDESSIWIII